MTPAPRPESGAARLGALESQVMEVLWGGEALTVRGVIDRLPHDPAYTTIATVLGNLERKHLVARSRVGRAALYSARIGRHEHTAATMARALDSDADREAAILHFVGSMGDEDLDLLRRYLAERDEGGRA